MTNPAAEDTPVQSIEDPINPVADFEDHVDFPADAPIGQAHIIQKCPEHDLEDGYFLNFKPQSQPKPEYQLCDMIATLLSKLEQWPDALAQFFDHRIKSLRLVRPHDQIFEDLAGGENMDNFISPHLPFVIWRHKTQVFSAFYSPRKGIIRYKYPTLYSLDKVAPEAIWTPIWAAEAATAKAPIAKLWRESDCCPWYGEDEDISFNMEEADTVALKFAKELWDMQLWRDDEYGERFIVKIVAEAIGAEFIPVAA